MPRLFQVTARDHSAVILMAELARSYAGGGYTSLQDIADRMRLSQGYLEEIASVLKSGGLIIGKQGPGGGYRLAEAPDNVSLEDVLVALEGPMDLVDCQSGACPVESQCSSKSVWDRIQKNLVKTLRETSLAEVL